MVGDGMGEDAAQDGQRAPTCGLSDFPAGEVTEPGGDIGRSDLGDLHSAERRLHQAADIGLSVAESKSGVKKMSEGFEFLGFSVLGRYLRPRPKSLSAFKDRVRSLTRRQAPVSIRQMIEDLNPVIRGWGNYFALGDVVELFLGLAGWIRTRLRSKARGSMARLISRRIMPNSVLRDLGLVSLEQIVRTRRLSPT